jgi:hypothetical protein
MKQNTTFFKVANEDYAVKESRQVPDGIIYTTVIDGHDFCILESNQEKEKRQDIELKLK